MSKKTLSVTFWGVRGTMPTPQKEYQKYGGNTSCVQVSYNGHDIVLDGGSGLSPYGDAALAQGQREFHIAFSHFHYDHIIGLTRFAPLFRTDTKIHLYGAQHISSAVQDLFREPYFPISYAHLPSMNQIYVHPIEKEMHIEDFCISTLPLNHHQGAIAYRIKVAQENKSIVYATDHEHGTAVDEELIGFIKDAHLFIYDSTYSEQEYEHFKGWGHSTANFGAQLAKQGHVKKLALFHHDPSHNDEYLEQTILPEAQQIFLQSFLAQDGQKIELN